MRNTCVLKFGGSSLCSHEDVLKCARIAGQRREGGEHVVVVVSAMGSTTDQLLALGRSLGMYAHSRELDLLISSGEQISAAAMALALQRFRHEATPLTGGEAGLITTEQHGRSEIVRVVPDRIVDELTAGRIPVVMGFQGISPGGKLTTLGRGGSDTTAVALAGALSRSWGPTECEIYTDVDGVHTSDPRLVRGTRRLESIDYQQMRTLSQMGARVMAHPAISHAEHFDVPIRVSSCCDPTRGTTIGTAKDHQSMSGVLACALTDQLGQLKLSMPLGKTESSTRMIQTVCRSGIQFLELNHHHRDDCQVFECIAPEDNLEQITEAIRSVGEFDPASIRISTVRNLSRIALVGRALTDHEQAINTALDSIGEAECFEHSVSLDDEKCLFFVNSSSGNTMLQRIHDRMGLSSDLDYRR